MTPAGRHYGRCGFMDSYWISQAEPQTPRKIVQDVEPKAFPQHVWKPPGWVWATWNILHLRWFFQLWNAINLHLVQGFLQPVAFDYLRVRGFYRHTWPVPSYIASEQPPQGMSRISPFTIPLSSILVYHILAYVYIYMCVCMYIYIYACVCASSLQQKSFPHLTVPCSKIGWHSLVYVFSPTWLFSPPRNKNRKIKFHNKKSDKPLFTFSDLFYFWIFLIFHTHIYLYIWYYLLLFI